MRARLVLGALLPLLLAQCGDRGFATRLPIACPMPGLLGEGADLARYRPGPVKDLTTLEFNARLTGLERGCLAGRGDRTVDIQLTVGFAVDRGVAAEGRSVDLPWFVAVIDRQSERILSRQMFVDRVEFARNETRTSATGEPVTIQLPVSQTRSANDYRILVSFMLNEEELATNRRRGPR